MLERWDRDAALDVQRRAVQHGMQRRERLLRRALPLRGADADVDVRRCLGRHRVRRRARRDDRRGDRRSELGLGELGDREQLVRELDGRVRAELGIESCVRGAAMRLDAVEGNALALGLQRAVRARLEHECGLGSRSGLLDQRARARRAGLLVGGEHDGDTVEPLERGQCEEQLHDAGLHVEDPGPARASVAQLERPAGERPQRPDGVEVADEQDARRAAETPAEMHTPVHLERLAAAAEELGGELVGDARAGAARVRVHRRRLRLDERAQRVDHCGVRVRRSCWSCGPSLIRSRLSRFALRSRSQTSARSL